MTKKQRQTQKIFSITGEYFKNLNDDDLFKERPFLENKSLEPVFQLVEKDNKIERQQIYLELMEALEEYGWS